MDNLQENLPGHIAIIMDGNRRWAKSNNLSPKEGHKTGADNLEKIAKFCNKIGIKYLTVYAFSTENWNRSKEEISTLLLILKTYLESFTKKANHDNIRIEILGDTLKLSKELQKSINNAIEKTKNNTGLTLNIAFNYGGRAELVNAFKQIAQKIVENQIKVENITEDLVQNNLYTKGQPDPDLVIRTSGELRTSNFLPWQTVYSELYFANKHWPEFSEDDLLTAIEEYQRRNRRRGG